MSPKVEIEVIELPKEEDSKLQVTEFAEEETPELAMLGEAMEAAMKAYEDLLLDKHGIDPAFYRLSLKVERRDHTFTETLGELTWKDLA